MSNLGFHTHIIQMSNNIVCRQVGDLGHDFGGFTNGLNSPWVLSRLRLMLRFSFGFALSQVDQNWLKSDGYLSRTDDGVKLTNDIG